MSEQPVVVVSRKGALVGFADPFDALAPYGYALAAKTTATLQRLTRAALTDALACCADEAVDRACAVIEGEAADLRRDLGLVPAGAVPQHRDSLRDSRRRSTLLASPRRSSETLLTSAAGAAGAGRRTSALGGRRASALGDGGGGSEAEQVQARVLRLQQRLDAVTGQLAQAKRLTATLPLALQALELRLE